MLQAEFNLAKNWKSLVLFKKSWQEWPCSNMLLRCATVDYSNMCDTLQPEVDFLHSWPVVFPKFSGKSSP